MTAPEFTPVVERQVEQFEREYFTVQHKLPGVVDWPQEIPPVNTAVEALTAMDAHAGWYGEGDIRAVRKVVRTTVEVLTVPLSADGEWPTDLFDEGLDLFDENRERFTKSTGPLGQHTELLDEDTEPTLERILSNSGR